MHGNFEAMRIQDMPWQAALSASGPDRHSVPAWASHLRVGDMKSTVEIFVESDLAREAYRSYERTRGTSLDDGAPAERGFVQACECLLQGTVGAAAARVILAAVLRDRPATVFGGPDRDDDAWLPGDCARDRAHDWLDYVDVGVAVFDARRDLVAWNLRVLELLDIPRDLALNGWSSEGLARILAERSGLGSGDPDEATVRPTAPWCHLAHLANGRTVEVRGQGMPNGGMAVTFKDVTERRRLESELRKYRDHLDDLVRERTMQLELARQEALEACTARSMLAASLSHEIRTPLNGIISFARILQAEQGLAPRLLDGLSVIRSCGEHLLALVNHVLDISRMEAEGTGLSPRRADLHQILRPVLESARVLAAEKGLQIRHESRLESPCCVHLDDVRLGQVLFNLLGNAIKFTHEGEIVLRTRPIDVCGTRRRIAFEVVDTGAGISPSDIERIFLPFKQVGNAQARKGGAGLGLHISRQLVRLMGGDIRVVSSIGVGSTFAFDVPLDGADLDGRTNAQQFPAPD
jgi:signal transduction histidine kinase